MLRGPTPSNETVLPQAQPALELCVSVWSSPAGAAQAGGDWCDVFAISEHVLGLTVGDVSGHGGEVAGMMGAMRTAVLRAMHHVNVPSEVLALANAVALSQARGAGVIVTAIVAILDQRGPTLTFANAGHPPPLMLTSEGHAFLRHAPADLPLGIFRNYRAADYVVALPSDALLVLYTDGITEHDRDPVAGEIELIEAARLVHAQPNLDAARAIARQVLRRTRGDDDAAAIGLRMTPRRAAESGAAGGPLHAVSSAELCLPDKR